MTYKVGYGKPPKSGQFKKGKSGNPTGRPSNSRNFSSYLIEELSSHITVTEGTNKKTYTKMQAMAKKMVHDALTGPTRSAEAVLDTMKKLGLLTEENMTSLFPDNHDEILQNYVERMAPTKNKSKKSSSKNKLKKRRIVKVKL